MGDTHDPSLLLLSKQLSVTESGCGQAHRNVLCDMKVMLNLSVVSRYRIYRLDKDCVHTIGLSVHRT